MDEPVHYETGDGVAIVTLHRPERNNAWTPAMGTAYLDALEAAGQDPEVRAIVVTGAGRMFCPGADMELLAGGGRDADVPRDERPVTLPIEIPKPVIGALNGACAGIGLVYALTFDLRFAAAGARLTTAFSRVGLVAEYGSSWLLPRLVGVSAALDLLLSGRTVTAEEASELGLVDRVHPPDEVRERALDYARMLSNEVSPTAMGVIKRQVYGDLDRPLTEARERAERLMVESFRRPDVAEGAASFVERRPPRFAPLDPDAV